MSGVARDAGVSRENLYRALGANGKPEFATVMKVLDALGVQLVAKPKAA
jgi:probable addiction module antidote protein